VGVFHKYYTVHILDKIGPKGPGPHLMMYTSIYYLFGILYCFMYTQENNLRPVPNQILVAVADDATNNLNDYCDLNINSIIEVNYII